MLFRASEWLSPALSLVCLTSLSGLPQTSHAIELDITNSTSIKAAASTIVWGMMSYYVGNETGQIAGELPGPYYWWEAGAMWGQMIQYWYYTGDSTYNDEVIAALQHQVGTDDDFMPANQSADLGNDDQVFWAFAAMDAAELNFTNPPSTDPQWLALAQAVFNEQAARWDAGDCGGGIRWQIYSFNAGYDYKNAISNGGFFQLAARLARYTKNATYADWAEKEWAWFSQSVLFEESDWQINDGTSTTENCTVADQLQWSYNYATWIVGMAYMYNYTDGNSTWLYRLEGLLNTTLTTFFPTSMGDKIMVEIECEPLGNCDDDQKSFKTYLSRWLAVTAQLVPSLYDRIFEYLEASAAGAAGQCSGGTGSTCGMEWNTTVWDGTSGVGQQMCALAVIQAMLITTEDIAAPYSNTTGGTSQGDSSAGTGTDSTGTDGSAIDSTTITTADKAGAGIVTAVLLFTVIVGSWWMLFVD